MLHMMNGQSWQVHFRGIGAQKKTLFVSSNQQIPNSQPSINNVVDQSYEHAAA
jgi:hypothetical protein